MKRKISTMLRDSRLGLDSGTWAFLELGSFLFVLWLVTLGLWLLGLVRRRRVGSVSIIEGGDIG